MTQKIVLEEKYKLDCYLEESRDKSTNINKLDWCKVNWAKYPIISRKVSEILSILVSIVASESA